MNPLAAEPRMSVCTTREASKLLGVSLRTIQLWVDAKRLDAWKTPGGHRRITRRSLEDLFNKRAQPACLAREAYREGGSAGLTPQPIISIDQTILGYELRPVEDSSADEKFAAHAISNAVTEWGIQSAIGSGACIIKLSDKIFTDELANNLEPGRVIFALSAEKFSNPAMQTRCISLKQAGFRILLDITSPAEISEKALSLLSFVRHDFASAYHTPDRSSSFAKIANTIPLIGAGINDAQTLAEARQAGCQYLQGFDLARRIQMEDKYALAGHHAAVLNLFATLHGEPFDEEEITRLLQQRPVLYFSLQRLLNSPAGGISRRVESLNDILRLLGRPKLIRWTLLLLFTNRDRLNSVGNPLMQSASYRARLMEYLARLASGRYEYRDKAFLLGLLSQAPILQADLFKYLSLPTDMRLALQKRSGFLGTLLALTETLETGNKHHIDTLARQLGIRRDAIMRGIVESLSWSNTLAHAD